MNASANESENVSASLDTVGACLSFACAVHCILMPFVLTILPLLGLSALSHHLFDIVMFSITVSLATLSLCWGVRVHKRREILLLVALGVLLFYLGGFHAESVKDAIFVGLGGLCLVAGHLLNRRLCRSCKTCCGKH
ncbi:MAG: MerC domain-containing protein [Oligoflexia bacterium]|nr:MerC domain-containing protein [Oligoflexia bacterium]